MSAAVLAFRWSNRQRCSFGNEARNMAYEQGGDDTPFIAAVFICLFDFWAKIWYNIVNKGVGFPDSKFIKPGSRLVLFINKYGDKRTGQSI